MNCVCLQSIVFHKKSCFSGQNPVDIQEFLYPPKKKWTPPPDDVRFSNLEDPIPDTEMPDYHEETLYQVSNGAKFSEGMLVPGIKFSTC